MQNKVRGLFGGKKKSGGGSGDSSSSGGGNGFLWILLLGLVIWAATGFYIVQPGEQAVVLRFGVPVKVTTSGAHWAFPFPIERVEKRDVEKTRRIVIEAQMLTRDRNLIAIKMAIAFKIRNVREFLFNVRRPYYTLQQSLDSALREVVGSQSFNDLLAKRGGRQKLGLDTHKQLQRILDEYKAGIKIRQLSLSDMSPPQDVKSSYVDANEAVNDAKTEVEQAEKYRAKVVKLASGKADALLEAAQAHKIAVVQLARGKANAFLRVLAEYNKAPEITRRRMYIDTMSEVLAKVKKVVVRLKQGNSVLFIPLDRYMKGRQSTLSSGN